VLGYQKSSFALSKYHINAKYKNSHTGKKRLRKYLLDIRMADFSGNKSKCGLP